MLLIIPCPYKILIEPLQILHDHQILQSSAQPQSWKINLFPSSSPVFSMCSESMKSNNQANNCQSNPDEHRVHLHATMLIEDHGHQLLLEEVASR